MKPGGQKEYETESYLGPTASQLLRGSVDHGFEVDFAACARAVVKRKNIVFAAFFFCVFVTGAVSFLLPRVYEVSVIIAPPVVTVSDLGVVNLDTIANMKAQIDSGAFNPRIAKDLHLSEMDESSFRTDLLRGGVSIAELRDVKAMRVSLREKTENLDTAKRVLLSLVEQLNQEYRKYIGDKGRKIENQIAAMQSQTQNQKFMAESRMKAQLLKIDGQISSSENAIRLKNEEIKLLSQREIQLLDEIKETKANSERLVKQREASTAKGEPKDGVLSILLVNTVQQNISYFTQLQNELTKLRTNKENLLSDISELRNGIATSREDRRSVEAAGRVEIDNLSATSSTEITKLKLAKDDMREVIIIQEPTVSIRPVWPKKRQNVLIAAVVGLMFGLGAALFLEWRSRPA